ncbi:MAG: hypothetical protein GY719_37005 [bacterium]|nr:hypothetical protein [bacterium]
MARYLTLSADPTECESCGRDMVPGAIALTDEIHGPGQLDPLCPVCLASLDADLTEFWYASERQRSKAVTNRAYELLAEALKRCGSRDGCALRKRLLEAE